MDKEIDKSHEGLESGSSNSQDPQIDFRDLYGDDDPTSMKNWTSKDEDEEFKDDENWVPQNLAEAEQETRAANLKKLEKDERKAEVKGNENEELTKEERYTRLMTLLEKSKFYSEHLKMKLEGGNDLALKLKEKLKKERNEKKGRNGKKAHPPLPNRGRKRKLDEPEHEDQDDKINDENGNPNRTFNSESIPEDQPLLLKGGIMRNYQIAGYQWMASLWENGINGILADEMGLGKTIQTIALFCYLMEMGVSGPFLVVAPLSTVPNWVKEINRFAPDIPVTLYHGSKDERTKLRRKLLKETFVPGIKVKVRPIFVTSYEISMNDRPFFANTRWKYVVVDEGHRLKNMHCRLIKELKMYKAANKLLLTGTPLQNNLSELWSLLNFLMSEIFDDLKVFQSWFNAKELHQNENESDRILQQEKENNILSTLHQILTPFLLRRVKADVDLKIPPKKELLVYCPMTDCQDNYYRNVVNRTINELFKKNDQDEELMELDHNGRTKRSRTDANYKVDDLNENDFFKACEENQSKIDAKFNGCSVGNFVKLDSEIKVSFKSRMMDLRKCTNHPYLIEYPLTEDGNFYDASSEMIEKCGKMKVLDQMLKELTSRGHKILIFSQMTRMLDILGDYLNLQKYSFSRLDGSMNFIDRQENIDRFNENPEYKIFLLSTRAGGLGINLTSADTCIIYDSDWNPQQDLQAQDRCHRIGQTKPVMIYRFVTANTIDEKIVERASAKRKLEKLVIHQSKFKSQDSEGLKKTMETISPKELVELLNSKDHAAIIKRGNDDVVFSKEELDALLDRSGLTWNKLNRSKSIDEVKDVFKVIDVDGIPEGLQSLNHEIEQK